MSDNKEHTLTAFEVENADAIKKSKKQSMINTYGKLQAEEELQNEADYTARETATAKKRTLINNAGKRQAEEEERSEAEFKAKLRPTGERNVDTYDVKGVNLRDKKATKRAIREMLVAQDAYCLQMGDLMNQDLNYKTLGGDSKEAKAELSQRLKSYNDAYTMSMLSSCYAPLSQGVSLGTLFETAFNKRAIEAANPDMKMDTSRFWANMSQQIVPIMEKNALLRPFADHARKSMNDKANDSMNAAIAGKLRENDFDSLIMTPRQVAILKVNFMEQYYVDMRSKDPNSANYAQEMNDLKNVYGKSMKHLQAVAENSGFDMSVVAAEERYFVGLKMRNNPDAHYENIFNETYSIYGAAPNYRVGVDDKMNPHAEWDGKFVTADGHAFTAAYGDENGSFTVREPLNGKSLDAFNAGLKRQALQYAQMINYLDSDECPCGDKVKTEAKKWLKDSYDRYTERTAKLVMDDLGYDKKTAAKHIADNFTKEFDAAREADIVLPDFKEELEHVSLKSAYATQGINPYAEKIIDGKVDVEGTQKGRDAIRSEYMDKAKAYYMSRGGDNRSAAEFDSDVSNNWIESLDTAEMVSLLSHVGTNMEQGYKERGSTSRSNKLSSIAELGAMALDKGNAVHEHAGSSMTDTNHSEREVPVLQEAQDDDYEDQSTY